MVTLMFGPEPWLRDQALNHMMDSIGNPELNISRFEGYSDSMAEACDLVPCLAATRLVICENPEKVEFPKVFFDSIPDTTHLVLISDKVDKRKTLFKTLSKLKAIREFGKYGRADATKHVATRSGLQPELAEFLLDRSGYLVNDHVTLYDLENELSKFKGLANVTREHIEQLVHANPAEDVFKTTQLVLDGDTSGALHYARSLCERKLSDPIALASLMLRIYRIAYKVRLCNGKSRSELIQELGVDPRTLSQIETLRVSTDTLHAWIGACNDAVLSIKRGRMPDDIALDVLICALKA